MIVYLGVKPNLFISDTWDPIWVVGDTKGPYPKNEVSITSSGTFPQRVTEGVRRLGSSSTSGGGPTPRPVRVRGAGVFFGDGEIVRRGRDFGD